MMTIDMQEKQIPVLLLTGYLGSGKTTLLNNILANRKGIKFAVIVNDIGEVNIDAELIEKGGVVGQGDDSLVALQNGCICCTLKMDLVNQLAELTSMHRFDYIVIEASGICEPAPIAQTICSLPQLAPVSVMGEMPYVDSIVTVVDALRMRDEFDGGAALEKEDIEDEDLERLVIEQLEFCNIVLLNKASEVSADELGKLRAIVKNINPEAKILECDYGNIDLDEIIYTGLFDFDRVATSAAWIAEIEGHDEDDDDDEDEHEEHHHEHEEHEGHEQGHHHHHHHDEGEALEYGIETFVYTRREPFDINKFDYLVTKKWPKNIIRAKGICYFADEPDKCYLFEQAGRQMALKDAGYWFATMDEEALQQLMERDAKLRRDWDPVYGDRMVKLVFIGQHLDKTALTTLLDDTLA